MIVVFELISIFFQEQQNYKQLFSVIRKISFPCLLVGLRKSENNLKHIWGYILLFCRTFGFSMSNTYHPCALLTTVMEQPRKDEETLA